MDIWHVTLWSLPFFQWMETALLLLASHVYAAHEPCVCHVGTISATTITGWAHVVLAVITPKRCRHLILNLFHIHFKSHFICSNANNMKGTKKKEECIYWVEQDHTEVLDDAVESHELEHAEWCNEGSSTLPVEGQTKQSVLEFNFCEHYVNIWKQYFTFCNWEKSVHSVSTKFEKNELRLHI